MFQMDGIGPRLGQPHHFRRYSPEQIDYAVERYTWEESRLYGMLEWRLETQEHLTGEYSIADMAVFPWIRPYRWQSQDLAGYPSFRRRYDAVKVRPAVLSGLAVLAERLEKSRKKPEREVWNTLFGQGEVIRGHPIQAPFGTEP
jgi:GST-like protein